MTQEEAIDVVLSVEEEELSEYAQKYARLDEFGRKAVQAIIREEAERCRAQGTLGSSKTYSAFNHISRKNYSQE